MNQLLAKASEKLSLSVRIIVGVLILFLIAVGIQTVLVKQNRTH